MSIRSITILFGIILLLTTNTVFAERGYARIENGTLVTDHGDLIRGCHSHIMSFAKEKYQNLSWWQALRDKGHLNCVRMMAYNSPSWYGGSGAGVNTQDLGGWLDIAVENAAKAGMYIIIDDHSYCCGSKMPLNEDSYQHGRDFWNYVAQRYGKYTHVIFEIKNEPPDGAISSDSWTTHTKSLYKIIRSYAPNTPVITHTPGADNDNELTGGINKCGSGNDPISYSPDGGNALVAWHGYGTGDLNSGKTDLKGPYVWQAQKLAGVICDEFGDDQPDHGYDIAKFLESKNISWVWLCVNEMEFGKGTAIKTGYDWVRYPPTWPKDPYAGDMPPGPSGGSGCIVNLSKTGHSFSAGAGNTTVTVTSDESFTAGDDRDWITVSKNGNDVSITVTENTGADSRSGTVTISGCSNKTITITQAGQGSTGGSGSCGTGEASFIQSAGEVVIEAENFNDNKQQNDQVQWQTGSSQGGYSGSGYVYVEDGSTNNNNGDVPDNTRLTYNIEFTGGGTYTIWIRRWAPDGAGNSVFATLGGIQSSGTDNAADEGIWTWKSLGTVTVSGAGVYVLELIRREDGYLADKIVINSGEQPSGEGPDETNCVATSVEAANPENLIKIYPNPAIDHTIIDMGALKEKAASFKLTNHLGQLIVSVVPDKTDHLIRLNTSELPQGIYFLSIDFQGERVIKKLLVFRN